MTTLPDPRPLIDQLIKELGTLLAEGGREDPLLIGILTGGLWVAEQLADGLGMDASGVGVLDIGFHRDDFDARGLPAGIQPTRLAGVVEGRHVILVDDVLQSGRTARAAINALFEYGRPGSITLAVLIDRGDRQLPIQPDLIGGTLDIPSHQKLKLSGPEPLVLALQEQSP
jgi:pyrimidine operon attenuation protein/uracil phosphoribosyltransferase